MKKGQKKWRPLESDFTDESLATFFATQHWKKVRYDQFQHKWYVREGRQWKEDEAQVRGLLVLFLHSWSYEAMLSPHIDRTTYRRLSTVLETMRKQEAVLSMARWMLTPGNYASKEQPKQTTKRRAK
jgi:hypothetical protein